MEVQYTKKALKKMCPDWQCIRSFGDNIGRKILLRITQFKAASCLDDLRNAPGLHEELKENRKTQLSCRLTANWRLIYRPFGNWEEYLENGSLSWKKVDKIEIIEAEDYHNN
ncbi:MAG: type II toxin-antitoxin system RelE/ParE family toxin [Candidatus Parcubacteria bacterium]|jgi:plasmid maintenance system killer protein|nr:MAG: hypothetical protein JST_1980 [Candidatus Parcubacteria bacterium]